MRVSQLAKELNRDSKEIIAILDKKGIEGKKPQSGIDSSEESMIRNALGGGNSATAVKEAKSELVKEMKVEQKKIGRAHV